YYRIETYNCNANTRLNTDEGSGTPTASGLTAICDVQDYDPATGYSVLYSTTAPVTVTIKGIAICDSGVFQPTMTSFWIQGDDGCGVNIFMYDLLVTAISEGDEVVVTGEVDEYNGLTEVKAPNEASIIVTGTGTIPSPQVITTGYAPFEPIEGKLVQTKGTVSSKWDRGFVINDGSGNLDVYVDPYGATGIDLSTIENGEELTVTGIASQYDSSMPYLSDYQILPRKPSDLEKDGKLPQGPEGPDPAIFAPDLNETTDVSFNASSGSHVVIRIYNLQGVHVTTIFDGVTSGRAVTWDGKDQLRHKLPIGVYIINIQVVDIDTGKTRIRNYPVVIATKLN
ncbi:hypothetical protein KAU33_09970, partial [Candidatus Dependentiae bacterium]|nr:hypothetical protein [Candidatus Dependentiae bacterium]